MNNRIEVVKNHYRNTIEIWVIQDGSEELNLQYDTIGNIEYVKYRPGLLLKPLIELPRGLGEEILFSILKYFERNNIKPESESLREGKLIATENHLKDMQEITNKLLSHLIK